MEYVQEDFTRIDVGQYYDADEPRDDAFGASGPRFSTEELEVESSGSAFDTFVSSSGENRCFSVFSPGKLINPKLSQSDFSISSWSIRHPRYCLAKIRQLGAFLFSVNFIQFKYLVMYSVHSPK